MPEEEDKYDTEITIIKNGITSKKIVGGGSRKKRIIKRIIFAIALSALYTVLFWLDIWMWRGKDLENGGLVASLLVGGMLGVVGLLLIIIPRQFIRAIRSFGKKLFPQTYAERAIPEGRVYRQSKTISLFFNIAAILFFLFGIFLSFAY